MACSTRPRVSAEMGTWLWDRPLSTYDTVARDTPARRATSIWVGRFIRVALLVPYVKIDEIPGGNLLGGRFHVSPYTCQQIEDTIAPILRRVKHFIRRPESASSFASPTGKLYGRHESWLDRIKVECSPHRGCDNQNFTWPDAAGGRASGRHVNAQENRVVASGRRRPPVVDLLCGGRAAHQLGQPARKPGGLCRHGRCPGRCPGCQRRHCHRGCPGAGHPAGQRPADLSGNLRGGQPFSEGEPGRSVALHA